LSCSVGIWGRLYHERRAPGATGRHISSWASSLIGGDVMRQGGRKARQRPAGVPRAAKRLSPPKGPLCGREAKVVPGELPSQGRGVHFIRKACVPAKKRSLSTKEAGSHPGRVAFHAAAEFSSEQAPLFRHQPDSHPEIRHVGAASRFSSGDPPCWCGIQILIRKAAIFMQQPESHPRRSPFHASSVISSRRPPFERPSRNLMDVAAVSTQKLPIERRS
jgi:hypothetical protein